MYSVSVMANHGVRDTYNLCQGAVKFRGIDTGRSGVHDTYMAPRFPKHRPRKRVLLKREKPLAEPTYLREFRLAFGYTQEKLGELLGVTHAQVNRWENRVDNLPQQRVKAAADLFGTTPGRILDGPPPAPRK